MAPVSELAAMAGAITLGALAALYVLVAWRVRAAWARTSALGYLAGAAYYALNPWTRPVGGHPALPGMLCATCALACISLGFAQSLPLSAGTLRRWRGWLLALVAPILVGSALGLLTRPAAMLFAAVMLASSGGLALWAARAEPRSGHGLVAASLLLFPLAWVLMMAGLFGPDFLRYGVIVPVTVSGMTVMTTALLRAQRQAQRELAQRKAAQAELQQLNASLEDRVQQRTAELRDLVAGLESFNRSVSHDLRGPLGGIAGVSRLAADALAHGDTVTADRLCRAITAQAESSQRLVEALLVLARMEDAQVARQPVALGELVDEVVQQLRLSEPALAQPAVAIEPLPVVQADPMLVRQVFANLIGNALKFSRSAAAPRVEVGAQLREDGSAVLYVRDNGVGFDPSQLHRLFQPFERLHGGRFPGHGVGLSIVRRVVERHGGRVWAEGAAGQGATFYFTLAPA
jgi:signal transduction histidine kinase